MSLDVYLKDEIKSIILAGLVQSIQIARAHGTTNVEFVRGTLTAYQHQAIAFGIDWPALLAEARCALQSDPGAMIDGRPAGIIG